MDPRKNHWAEVLVTNRFSSLNSSYKAKRRTEAYAGFLLSIPVPAAHGGAASQCPQTVPHHPRQEALQTLGGDEDIKLEAVMGKSKL